MVKAAAYGQEKTKCLECHMNLRMPAVEYTQYRYFFLLEWPLPFMLRIVPLIVVSSSFRLRFSYA